MINKKENVYVVVDTPKKAKKLKKLLDMFGEEIGKIKAGWKTEHYGKYGWVSSSVCHDKTKVSIKELRNILAVERLKEGDYVVCKIGDTEYIVEFDSFKNNNVFGKRYITIHKDGTNGDIMTNGAFVSFKRYATPEEVTLLEQHEENKELIVGRWYKQRYLCNGKYDGYLLFNFNGDFSEDSQYGFTHTSIGQKFVNDISIYEEKINQYTEATPKEVEESLIEEANRRYKVGDKIKSLSHHNEVRDLDFKYIKYYKSDDLWVSSESNMICVYRNGKWAEVIKPEEKPKVGDVIAVYNQDEFKCIEVFREYHKHQNFDYITYKTITQQEAIDLLFKK